MSSDKCDKWIHKTCANISDKKYAENKTGWKTNQVKKSGFVLDALTFPFQTLIIKNYYFYMKMKIILLVTKTLLNLELPAVFVYVN